MPPTQALKGISAVGVKDCGLGHEGKGRKERKKKAIGQKRR